MIVAQKAINLEDSDARVVDENSMIFHKEVKDAGAIKNREAKKQMSSLKHLE